MKLLKTNPAGLLLAAFFLLLLTIGTNAQASGGGPSSNTDDLYSKLEKYLQQSSYKTQKLGTTGWLVTYKNERILVGVQDDIMIAAIIVAKKGEYPNTLKAMKDLLMLADELDLVKILIDDDQDILVRWEWKGRNLEKELFNEMMSGVVVAADHTRRTLGSFEN